MDDIGYDPKQFADEAYARDYAQLFDKYAELRVYGKPRDMAVLEAFELIKNGIDTGNVHRLGLAAETNRYVQERMAYWTARKDVRKDLWPEKKAVRKLLELIEDDGVRESVRLNAITALNVLCGYVQMDDEQSRRIGHTMADFAKMEAEEYTPATKHVNGSDERQVH